MSDSSAEDIEIAKAVLAGWQIVPCVSPAPWNMENMYWNKYDLFDPQGKPVGSYRTRYTAACAATSMQYIRDNYVHVGSIQDEHMYERKVV